MRMDVSSLSTEQKVGQLFFIGIDGPVIDAGTRGLLDEVSPGGVCLFARNIRERQQTRELLDELRETLPLQPLLSIDQEGGLVDRLRRLLTPMPAANRIRTADDAREHAAIIADALIQLGFNMDFAPVVDVIDDKRAGKPNGLFSREFGRSAEEVIELAGAFLIELQNRGIIGCPKHFPGLGAAVVDSHEELPMIDRDEVEIMGVDLAPYRAMIHSGAVHAVMVAHAAYPNFGLQERDKNGKLLPSSLSYSLITTLLRGELAFDGLVITDDLEMGAIVKNYGISEACKLALNAGVDMLAICSDPENVRAGHRAVLKAVIDGEIKIDRLDQSIKRISEVRARLAVPKGLIPATFDALSGRITDFQARLDLG